MVISVAIESTVLVTLFILLSSDSGGIFTCRKIYQTKTILFNHLSWRNAYIEIKAAVTSYTNTQWLSLIYAQVSSAHHFCLYCTVFYFGWTVFEADCLSFDRSCTLTINWWDRLKCSYFGRKLITISRCMV